LRGNVSIFSGVDGDSKLKNYSKRRNSGNNMNSRSEVHTPEGMLSNKKIKTGLAIVTNI
jgi:hypothetical protein